LQCKLERPSIGRAPDRMFARQRARADRGSCCRNQQEKSWPVWVCCPPRASSLRKGLWHVLPAARNFSVLSPHSLPVSPRCRKGGLLLPASHGSDVSSRSLRPERSDFNSKPDSARSGAAFKFWPLYGRLHRPNLSQNSPEVGRRCKAHGSISVQEGEPNPDGKARRIFREGRRGRGWCSSARRSPA
jgi:hypothetical protein